MLLYRDLTLGKRVAAEMIIYFFTLHIHFFFFVIERGVYKPEKRNYNKIKRGVVNPGCLVFMPTKNR